MPCLPLGLGAVSFVFALLRRASPDRALINAEAPLDADIVKNAGENCNR